MNLITYPLNNVTYSAADAELFHVTRTSGVHAGTDFAATVSGTDNNVTIGAGIAWIKNGEFAGKVAALKESATLDLDVPDSVYPRIDAIVLRYDSTKNATEVVVKAGVAASTPVAPDVTRTESTYELHLYHVNRVAGASVISSANVTDLRLNPTYCGLMADSVTNIDTSAISAQVEKLISDLEAEIDAVEDGSAFILKTETVGIENGGTGGTTKEEAAENLGINDKVNKAGDTMTGALQIDVPGNAAVLRLNALGDYSEYTIRAQAPGALIMQDIANQKAFFIYNGTTQKITSLAADLDVVGYSGQCTDPDEITESGFYYMTGSTTNAPDTGGYMLAAFMSNGRGTQIAAINGASSRFWIRSNVTGDTGGWQTWRKIVTTDMFSYSAGTLNITM